MRLKNFVFALAIVTLLLPLAANAGGAMKSNDGKWQVRARVLGVIPDEDSSTTIRGSVTADDAVVPELDITYFWTKHIASELILAATPHDIGATGTTLGNLDLGSVWLLPPTLTVQYHFNPDGRIRPYAGAGLNYTFFFDQNPGSSITRIEYDNNIGYALQAGVDYAITGNWLFNVDVKKIYLNTDVSINNGAITADVDLDPWIVGAGIGYRF